MSKADLTEAEIVSRLEKSLLYGGGLHDLEDVKDALRVGKFQSFWNDNGLLISQIDQYPKARYLTLLYAAGTWQACMALQPKLIEFARAMGCKAIFGAGRPGWERPLTRAGWKMQPWRTFRLDVEGA